MQVVEHPSWGLVLLSSHISGVYTIPFPQTGFTAIQVPSIKVGSVVPKLQTQELLIYVRIVVLQDKQFEELGPEQVKQRI